MNKEAGDSGQMGTKTEFQEPHRRVYAADRSAMRDFAGPRRTTL